MDSAFRLSSDHEATPHSPLLASVLPQERGNLSLRPYLRRKRAQDCGRRVQSLLARLLFDTPYWRRRVDIVLLYTIAVINLVLLELGLFSGLMPEQVTIFEWVSLFWVFLLGIGYSYLQERFNASLISYAVNMLTHIMGFAANVEASLEATEPCLPVAVFGYRSIYTSGCPPVELYRREIPMGEVIVEMQHIMRALPYAAGVSFRAQKPLSVALLPMPGELRMELEQALTGSGSYLKAMLDMVRSRLTALQAAKLINRQVQLFLIGTLDRVEMSGAETEYRNTARPMSAFLRQLLSLAIYPSLLYLPFVTFREIGFVLSLLLMPYALVVLLGADELLNTLYYPFDARTDVINIGMDIGVWTQRAACAVDHSFDALMDRLMLLQSLPKS